MNSILKEEFRSTQQGTEPGADFFKNWFDMSTSYANKVLLHLVQMGYIKFFGGYEADKKRIREFLYHDGSEQKAKPEIKIDTLNTGSNDSEKERVIPDTESITATNQTPRVTGFSEKSIIDEDMPTGDISQDGSKKKQTKNNEVGAKNRRKQITVSPHTYNDQESEVFINTDDSEELVEEEGNPKGNYGIALEGEILGKKSPLLPTDMLISMLEGPVT